MYLLHNIGNVNHPNYNTREEILNSEGVLTFDGIYKNVYENQDVLEGREVYFFVMGDYVGKDNQFDLLHVPKLEQYCTWKEINEMVEKHNVKLGWHTYSHPDLTTLTKEEIIKEITPPFPMKYLSYPHGKYNDLVLECVKEVGFEDAFSVTQGDNERYKRNRSYL